MDKQSREAQREAVKVLAIAVGVREAARQLGINENTAIQWSKRGNWFKQPEQKPVPPTITKQNGESVISVIKPSAALQNTLQQRRDKSRLHLSEYVEKASYRASQTQEKALLKVSGDVKNVATVMEKLWPEQNAGDSPLNLQVLSQNTVIAIGSGSASVDATGE